jgi:hypothetical protein
MSCMYVCNSVTITQCITISTCSNTTYVTFLHAPVNHATTSTDRHNCFRKCSRRDQRSCRCIASRRAPAFSYKIDHVCLSHHVWMLVLSWVDWRYVAHARLNNSRPEATKQGNLGGEGRGRNCHKNLPHIEPTTSLTAATLSRLIAEMSIMHGWPQLRLTTIGD